MFLESKARENKFEKKIGAAEHYDCFSPEFTDGEDEDDDDAGMSISAAGCLYAEWNEKYPIDNSREFIQL